MKAPAPVLEMREISQVYSRFDGIFDVFARRIRMGQAKENLVAVDGLNLTVNTGEIVGIVGESGCGKSTMGRIAVQLLRPTSGQVYYKGADIASLTPTKARQARLKLQMVFQNPYASLNPRLRIGETISEAGLAHGIVDRANVDDFVAILLQQVGMDTAIAHRYPHQLSGGQRQRIGIARALSVQPDCIVFDEAVAALDVCVQAQILKLLIRIRRDRSLTSIFISHDLNVVRYVADRVGIMYLGRIVEMGTKYSIFENPQHPYTQLLLTQLPNLGDGKKKFVAIDGEIPSPIHPPSGCHFHPRCPHAMEICRTEKPTLKKISPGHESACHLDYPNMRSAECIDTLSLRAGENDQGNTKL